MNFPILIELLIKSAAILLAAALVDRAWSRASAAQRHLVWLAAFASLLLLPATRLIAPRWNLAPVVHVTSSSRVSVSDTNEDASHAARPAVVAERASPTPIDWSALAMGLWLAGSALLLAQRVVGGVRLRLMLRASAGADDALLDQARRIATEFGITRPIALRVSRACRVPLTWGMWRPVLMLPADCTAWPDEQLRAALRHECAHIRRGDFAVRLLADVVRAFYWPNPLVWFASRALRTAQEQACDDLVLHAGTCPTDYATLLCEAARRFTAPSVAVAMAQPSTLETRVLAIVDATRDRRPLTLRTAFLGALSIAFALALSTTAQVRATDPAPVDVAETVPDAPSKIPHALAEATPVQAPERNEITQVLIEARFVELKPGIADSGALLSSLGIVAKPEPPTANGIQLLTKTSIDAAIFGIKKGGDLFSTPKVTTRSGQTAIIEIIRERRYATQWKKGAARGVWKPTVFETRNCGTTLEVMPVIQADGTIALKTVPQVVDFLGFVNLDTGKPMPLGTDDSAPAGPRLKAVFSEFMLDAKVVLKSGEAAMLEPLKQIEDVKPFANRVRKVKPVVFITASIIKPNGDPVPAPTDK